MKNFVNKRIQKNAHNYDNQLSFTPIVVALIVLHFIIIAERLS